MKVYYPIEVADAEGPYCNSCPQIRVGMTCMVFNVSVWNGRCVRCQKAKPAKKRRRK